MDYIFNDIVLRIDIVKITQVDLSGCFCQYTEYIENILLKTYPFVSRNIYKIHKDVVTSTSISLLFTYSSIYFNLSRNPIIIICLLWPHPVIISIFGYSASFVVSYNFFVSTHHIPRSYAISFAIIFVLYVNCSSSVTLRYHDLITDLYILTLFLLYADYTVFSSTVWCMFSFLSLLFRILLLLLIMVDSYWSVFYILDIYPALVITMQF